MSRLLQADDFGKTADLLAAVKSQFAAGAEIVSVVQDAQIVGLMLSPEAAKEVLARRAAERLVADPVALEDLENRLRENPESWD